MSDDLRTMLADAAEAEARRFDSEHRGEETTVYQRAIAPRRAARRAVESVAAIALVGVIGGVGIAVAHHVDGIEPSQPDSIEVLRSVTVDIDGLGLTRDGSVSTATERLASADVQPGAACSGLAAYSVLTRGSDGWVGAADEIVEIGSLEGAGEPVAVRARVFESPDRATAFVDDLAALADACAAGYSSRGAGPGQPTQVDVVQVTRRDGPAPVSVSARVERHVTAVIDADGQRRQVDSGDVLAVAAVGRVVFAVEQPDGAPDVADQVLTQLVSSRR